MKPQAIWKKQGFTIVELLVVIVVIGILATLTIMVYTSVQGKAATNEAEGDLRQAAMKIEAYRSSNGAYPASEAAVDDGRGLPKTNSNRTYTFRPAVTADRYCLSTYVTRTKKTIKISSPNNSSDGAGAITDGDCITAVSPIAFVGAGSADTGAINSSSVVVSKPAGVQSGDVMMIVATMIEGDRATADFDFLSGWVLLDSQSVTLPNKLRQSVWYRVADASEPSGYTVNAVTGSNCKMAATITSFRSVDTASPIMAFSYNTTATTTAAATYGGVTATANSYLVALGGGRGSAAFASAPATTAPYSVASSTATSASSYMYSYAAMGESLSSGTTKTPPTMTYAGTMTTNMTHSVLLREKTAP